MATQAQNWWEQDETIQPAATPATPDYPGVIRGQVSPTKIREEARKDVDQRNDAVRLDIASSSEARAGRDEGFDNAAKLRDEFRKAPESVNYEVVMRQFSSALGAQPTPTGDQALITAYAKMLDPGSVVREQEFNTVAAGDSKLGSIVARLQKEFGVDEGGLIRPEVRNRVLTEMKNLSDNYRQSYDRVRSDYERLADKYGIDPTVVAGTRVDEPYSSQVQKAWGERFPQGSDALPVGISTGEAFSTDQDKAIAAAVQKAFQSGGGIEELKAAAEAAGGVVSPDDLAAFNQAIDARAKKQPVTFTPTQTGRRNPISKLLGEAAMTPAGTAVVGATNAAGIGALSLLAGDQVQGLEALNPKAAFAGEVVGSALGTGALAKVGKEGVGRVSATLAERMAGGGWKGVLARTAATDAAYGGIYAANTGEDVTTGAALGALGSLVGAAGGAGVKKAVPAFGRVIGASEVTPPFGGKPAEPIAGAAADAVMPNADTGETYNVFRGVSPNGPNDFGVAGKGEYTSGRKRVAEAYSKGGSVEERTITLRNPLKMDYDELNSLQTELYGKPLTGFEKDLSEKFDQWLRSKGYDGVVLFDKEISTTVPEEVVKLADEPFVPSTVRSNDAGASGTSGDIMRLSKAEGLPVPVGLTQGAAARDAEQLAFEKEQIFGPLGGPLRARAEENNLQILQNFDQFIDLTGAQAPDVPATGNAVIKALTEGYKAAKDRVNVAYTRAEKAGDMAEPISYKEISDYIAEQTPTTREKLAPVLSAVSEQLRKNDPDGTGQIPLNALEDIRKLINKATTPGTADANYGGELKGLIDQATEGKGGALYKKARALRIEQARKFENRAVVERLVTNVKNKADAKTTSEEVFRKSILNESPEDIKFLRHALKTSGKDGRQAWKELQGATVRHIQAEATKNVNLTASNDPVVSAAALNKVVNQLDQNGRLDAIFDPAMAQRIRDLRDVVQYVNTVPPGTSINNSGTARTLLAALAEMGITGGATGVPVPLITGLKVLRGAVQDNRIKKKIAQSLIPKNSLSATQMGDYTIN